MMRKLLLAFIAALIFANIALWGFFIVELIDEHKCSVYFQDPNVQTYYDMDRRHCYTWNNYGTGQSSKMTVEEYSSLHADVKRSGE